MSSKLVSLTERERLAALRVIREFQYLEPQGSFDKHLAGAARALEHAHKWEGGRIGFGLTPACARSFFTHFDSALQTGMIQERRAVNYARWFTRRLRKFLEEPQGDKR